MSQCVCVCAGFQLFYTKMLCIWGFCGGGVGVGSGDDASNWHLHLSQSLPYWIMRLSASPQMGVPHSPSTTRPPPLTQTLKPQITGEKALSNELASFHLSNSSPIWCTIGKLCDEDIVLCIVTYRIVYYALRTFKAIKEEAIISWRNGPPAAWKTPQWIEVLDQN